MTVSGIPDRNANIIFGESHIYPKSEELFLCNDNPLNNFELKFFQLIFFACFWSHFKNICLILCVYWNLFSIFPGQYEVIGVS